MKATKKISIIIATFNAGSCLEYLIDSIILQKTEEIEFILIDGGSKDNTIDIINTHKQYIDYWISESDNGIYDAWNKGILAATGEWIMFLGADDLLLPGVLYTHLQYIQKHGNKYDVVLSKIDYVDKQGVHLRYIGEPWNWERFNLSRFSFAHPGLLHSADFFRINGLFDCTFKICGDAELFLRTKGNIKAGYLNEVTVKMQRGGVSLSVDALKESFKIRQKNKTLSNFRNTLRFIKVLVIFYLSSIKYQLLKISLIAILLRRIKPTKILVFSSFPAFTDNAYAVYKYIVSNTLFPDYRLVWITLNFNDCLQSNIPLEFKNKRTIVIPKKSLTGIYFYLRAKHVFITHGLYTKLIISRPKTIINLWHGMPLKRIGMMDNKGKNYMKNSQLFIATSTLFQAIMAQSFSKKMDNVLVIGQPRNDLLFEPTDFYKKNNIDKLNYTSIGIWLPTYRASIVGDIRVDGTFVDGNISFLDAKQLAELDQFLVKTNKLLIIKLHPMDKLQQYDFAAYKNLKIIKQKDFNDQLYPLLGSTDYLLTDVSSVWLDYNILGKPIGFVMDDLDVYKSSRGFTIPNLDAKLPGEIINTMDTLLDFISNPERFKIKPNNTYNYYHDNKACERLLDYLKN